MAYERIAVVANIGSIEAMSSGQGKSYIRMSVAVDRGTGERKNVVWYSVLLFGALAKDPEKILARYRVGRLVLVEGRPQVEAYLKRDGSVGLENAIIASSFPELLDHKPA